MNISKLKKTIVLDLHNMKFTKFIESLLPQVIKMKKIFNLC